MIKTRSESNEVLYPNEEIPVVTATDIEELKRMALLSPRQRVRLCVHQSLNDSLHEMFIIHARNCYVRPHKHIKKTESMAIIEGEVDIVLFNEDGLIRQINQLGAPQTGKIFFQRLPENIYHMLIIRSEVLVFHEIISGPFLRESTIFPDWAPVEQGTASIEFINKIESLIKRSEHK